MSTLDVLEALAAQNERHKLNFFGYDNEELERQVLVYVLDHGDKPFMVRLLPYIQPELFDSPFGYGLMRLVHEYRDEKGIIPSRGQILYEVEQVLTCDDRDHYDNIRS